MTAELTATASPATRPDDKTKDKPRHAPMYRVFIHNDDVTPMDFVVHILRANFQKPEEEAIQIMLKAHHTNIAHVATLPLEQAEFRVEQTHSLARARKFPLKLTYEPED